MLHHQAKPGRLHWMSLALLSLVILMSGCTSLAVPTAEPSAFPASTPAPATATPLPPTSTAAPEPTQTPIAADLPAVWGREAQVVVVGADLGGLCAALAAAEANPAVGLGEHPGGIAKEAGIVTLANVILLEASEDTGGVALASQGGVHIWGARSLEELLGRIPALDPLFGEVLMDNYADTVAWLEATGAPWQRASGDVASRLGPDALLLGDTVDAKRQTLDRLVSRLGELGGLLLTDTQVGRFYTNAEGRVVGVQAVVKGSKLFEIKVKGAVVVAPAGLGTGPEAVSLRTQVGAVLSDGFAVFQGDLDKGLSGPYPGIAINERTQAISASGAPIAGLYAIPHTAGGDWMVDYGESLALSVVLGRVAGANAAAEQPWY